MQKRIAIVAVVLGRFWSAAQSPEPNRATPGLERGKSISRNDLQPRPEANCSSHSYS